MKSKKRTRTIVPVKTARGEVHVMPHRDLKHPAVGRQPMSLARALTEPVKSAEYVDEPNADRVVTWRRWVA